MAVKIRCRRTGANNDPSYRIVATDVRSARDGKYLENLGWYNPKRTGINFNINLDRIEQWRSKGAMISDTVRSLVRRAKGSAKSMPQASEAK